jgi:hypothetical protein
MEPDLAQDLDGRDSEEVIEVFQMLPGSGMHTCAMVFVAVPGDRGCELAVFKEIAPE